GGGAARRAGLPHPGHLLHARRHLGVAAVAARVHAAFARRAPRCGRTRRGLRPRRRRARPHLARGRGGRDRGGPRTHRRRRRRLRRGGCMTRRQTLTAAAADAELLDFLRERRDQLVELARELVATPSPNPPGDERAVAALLIARLRELGLREVETVGAVEERPNVIARAGAGGGRTLVLCGHLDTKPPGDLSEWRGDPYGAAIEDGELYGVGSGDMKGALAAMVHPAAPIEA